MGKLYQVDEVLGMGPGLCAYQANTLPTELLSRLPSDFSFLLALQPSASENLKVNCCLIDFNYICKTP